VAALMQSSPPREAIKQTTNKVVATARINVIVDA
jgi:hypothetical protein